MGGITGAGGWHRDCSLERHVALACRSCCSLGGCGLLVAGGAVSGAVASGRGAGAGRGRASAGDGGGVGAGGGVAAVAAGVGVAVRRATGGRGGVAAAASVASQAGLAGLVRPVDVSQLVPAAGTGPCAPIQVAPNVWICLPCGGTPRLGGSSAIPRRKGLLSTVNLPPQVDLRASGLDGPVLDQQMVGVCWTFALADVMDNSLRRQGYSDVVAPMHVLASDTWDQMWQSGKSTDNLTRAPAALRPGEGVQAQRVEERGLVRQAYHVQPGSGAAIPRWSRA